MKDTSWLFCCAIVLLSCVSAQRSPADQDDVVLSSPDLTEPPPPSHSGLSCPAAPMRARGHKATSVSDSLIAQKRAALRVVVLKKQDNTILRDVHVALVALYPSPEPDARLVSGALTNATGVALVQAPPGEYYLTIQHLGFRSGTAKVKLRLGASDSVTVHLDALAVCD